MKNKRTGIQNALFTLWIKNFIGTLGPHSCINYPCNIEGGGGKFVSIGSNTYVRSHSIIGCWTRYGKDQFFTPSIKIGDNCTIGEYCQLSACDSITIGNGLLTGRYVYIGDNSHGSLSLSEGGVPPIKRVLISKGPICIGDNVWIGDKVTVLGGVSIGDNVIIGANSVVTHNIPSNSVAAGVPARIIKCL